ncbi:As/Sb Reductase [Trypanosoma theileri]|uniref:As/Sb Reductase n=1 Tax=Trypanosoma theileri TaxID=67003 RepID=A0A1X0NRP2_9TRYP|nr:As/Sb Reductase [Trypanosoma theileri]ORC87357.1 As/Sb Reductase [Trypanosoma theileri]
MNGASYTYMEPAELVALLDSNNNNSDNNNTNNNVEKVAVVDCRDEDRRAGHICRSLHFPAAALSTPRLVALAERLQRDGVAVAVFHCALSQVRGPRAAGRFAATLRDLGLSGPRVCVLRGGWEVFHAVYHDTRADLISYKYEEGEEED